MGPGEIAVCYIVISVDSLAGGLVCLQTMSLWGLEEGEGLLLHSLLCVLRVPGLALLDLWWTERASGIFLLDFME